MADELSPDYASPNLRWALLLEDYPGAKYRFDVVKGDTLGIPEGWGRDHEFVLATIQFPAETQKEDATGWKSLTSALIAERWTGPQGSRRKEKVQLEPDPDIYNVTCTKALGRALKKAGYSDDLPELKAMVVWRQRKVELRLLEAGIQPKALAAALDIRRDGPLPGQAGHDDNGPADIADAEIVDPETGEITTPPPPAPPPVPPAASDPPPSQELLVEVRKALGALGSRQSEAIAWANERGINAARPATAPQAHALLDQCGLLEQQPATGRDAQLAAESDQPHQEQFADA